MARAGAIGRYQKIFGFKRCMPKTVKDGVGRRICKVTDLVERTAKDFMKKFLSSKDEKSTITLSDLSLVQSIFSDYKNSVISKTSEWEVISDIEARLSSTWWKNAVGKRN